MPFLGFIGRFFKKLFGKHGILQDKIIPVAIEIVNNVKEWDQQHPEFADLLTYLLPGEKDDILKEKMRKALKYGLEQMGIFMQCLNNENEDEKIACIIKQLQGITNMDTKALMYSNLAAYVTKDLADDGKLDINEIGALVKIIYEGTHKDADADEELNEAA